MLEKAAKKWKVVSLDSRIRITRYMSAVPFLGAILLYGYKNNYKLTMYSLSEDRILVKDFSDCLLPERVRLRDGYQVKGRNLYTTRMSGYGLEREIVVFDGGNWTVVAASE